jgi:enoyl-CoA hydratase
MVMTGEIIDAETAHGWGISAYLSEDPALDRGISLAKSLALRAPLALQAAKAALVAGSESALAFDLERRGFEALMDSADKSEGIRAFREKRKPVFRAL